MTETPPSENLFELPFPLPDTEASESLVDTGHARIERIVSTGQCTPPDEWYDQDTDEWVALLQGEAELSFDDGSRRVLCAGDHIFIPSHRRHRVERTSSSPPCIWLAVHLPPTSHGS